VEAAAESLVADDDSVDGDK